MIGHSAAFGVYSFGLSPGEESRAQTTHEEAVVVDLLCQGPCGRRSFTEAMEREIAAFLAAQPGARRHRQRLADADAARLDGRDLPGIPPRHTRTLVGFDDVRDWPKVTRGRVACGYDDVAIRGILGENILRVFGEVASV